MNYLHSFLCPMWVAGKRLIAQGVDDTSRFRATPDSVPEMWVSALSPIRAPKTLWFALEIFIGDIGDMAQWHAKPEDLVGRCSIIMGHPWGNRFTCDAILKASVMDITTQVILVIPRRGFQRWSKVSNHSFSWQRSEQGQCLTIRTITNP